MGIQTLSTHDSFNSHSDDFEDFAARFDPTLNDRKARRGRKPKPSKPRRDTLAVVQSVTEQEDTVEGGFRTTYRPARYEQGWLLESLQTFFDQTLITDVLAQVKGGKEASVYRCAASPATGQQFLAAKVYRPQKFRNLRNDAMYREGRDVLSSIGKVIKGNEDRVMRALGKKTAFGVQVAHSSWLMYEYTTLEKLFNAGAAVPQPLASGENAILMSYCGDDRLAAPPLSQIALEPEEVQPLFDEVLRNVELMLSFGLIHGDLSAYNILYWDGAITLIDFPQVTSAHGNRSAFFILQRDIQRVCEYFARQGLPSDSRNITERLWKRYVDLFPHYREADNSRLEIEPDP
jgi:RIO kinase 1